MVKLNNKVAYQGYSQLDNTWGGKQTAALVCNMANQTIPVDKSLGYEALTHGNASSNGSNFWNITNAYPNWRKECTKFRLRKCHELHPPSPSPFIPWACQWDRNNYCVNEQNKSGTCSGGCIECPEDEASMNKCSLVDPSGSDCLSPKCWNALFRKN